MKKTWKYKYEYMCVNNTSNSTKHFYKTAEPSSSIHVTKNEALTRYEWTGAVQSPDSVSSVNCPGVQIKGKGTFFPRCTVY